MIHFSEFSGIGGFDLAAEWTGWKNYLSCEINPFGNKVLEYYWPDAYHHTDIHTLDYATIDTELSKRFGPQWRNDDIVLSGGFPCQPYSTAGKRLGKEDDRHLWPQMLRTIDEIQPTYVVGENVRGLTNWNGGVVFNEVWSDLEALGYEVLPFLLPACAVDAPHRRDRIWIVAYANEFDGNLSGFRAGEVPQFETSGVRQGHATSSDAKGGLHAPERETAERYTRAFYPWNDGGAWENFPTQSPLCSRNDGLSSRLDFAAVFEGIWPRQPAKAFGRWRTESIKAAGNAIVPQVAYQIFKAIQQFHDCKL